MPTPGVPINNFTRAVSYKYRKILNFAADRAEVNIPGSRERENLEIILTRTATRCVYICTEDKKNENSKGSEPADHASIKKRL